MTAVLPERALLPQQRSAQESARATQPQGRPRRYADVFVDWIAELGYTHCFFVAGGASMHLLDAVRTRMTCVPFINEMSAGIAAEYANEMPGDVKPFVLVTAGPGLTNLVTAMSGAWLESREMLVVGGQVKSSDLATGGIRQRGIQEIDGVALTAAVTKAAVRFTTPAQRSEVEQLVELGRTGRKGPVFLEVCLDVQGAPMDAEREAALRTVGAVGAAVATVSESAGPSSTADMRAAARAALPDLIERARTAQRPVFLIGGGISRETAREVRNGLARCGAAVMTTWNGADRVPADLPTYAGRPNTWGERGANALLQQADLVIALGTRLGLQQTGFAWEQFAPLATLVQVDIDGTELAKGHPHVDVPIVADANEVLRGLAAAGLPAHEEWLTFCREVRGLLPLRDPENETGEGFVCPYEFSQWLSEHADPSTVFVPCSSGGANSVPMQALVVGAEQTLISDKGLASMGYGLAGAIGAALGDLSRPVVLIEGDGGFAQNLPELGTVAAHQLDLKIFLFCNDGYGSIRTTQRNYFGGAYLGCDTVTGLGLPDWQQLFRAYGIPCESIDGEALHRPETVAALRTPGPRAFLVAIDPLQTYWPKISSAVTASGSMQSRPLHDMSPDLAPELARRVLRYMPEELLPASARATSHDDTDGDASR